MGRILGDQEAMTGQGGSMKQTGIGIKMFSNPVVIPKLTEAKRQKTLSPTK